MIIIYSVIPLFCSMKWWVISNTWPNRLYENSNKKINFSPYFGLVFSEIFEILCLATILTQWFSDIIECIEKMYMILSINFMKTLFFATKMIILLLINSQSLIFTDNTVGQTLSLIYKYASFTLYKEHIHEVQQWDNKCLGVRLRTIKTENRHFLFYLFSQLLKY